jgi:hypothetical protein
VDKPLEKHNQHGSIGGSLRVRRTPFGMRSAGSALALHHGQQRMTGAGTEINSTHGRGLDKVATGAFIELEIK